jgi:PDZ domain
MKQRLLSILWLFPLLATAADEAGIASIPPVTSCHSSVPRAWLGLRVAKPDLTLTAQVPALPPGIGFVVTSLDAAGPAVLAGFREFDLVWKLGDQWLVNEAQLAALLRLRQPGEQVTLAAFRGGKPLDIQLKLGETPAQGQPLPPELMDAVMLQEDAESPMRIVNLAEKSASYAADDGRGSIQRDAGFYQVRIDNSAGNLLFEGRFSEGESFERVPEAWRKRILALRRSLDHTLDGQNLLPRQPRPRVVPPPTKP